MVSLLVASALALGPSGCATVVRGTHQEVAVTSDDPSTDIRVDGRTVCQGPVPLRRGDDHFVTAEVGGRTETVRLEGDLSAGYLIVDGVMAIALFPFGLVAPIMDLIDGALWDLEPDHVEFRAHAPPERGAP